jgi:predicted  nucleic acid-binding Zn-ribbon protein
MPGPALILREIHRLRRFARDLANEMERGPRTLKTQQAKIAKQEEILKEWHEEIKHLKVATHEKEGTLRGKNQQIAKHEKQRNESTSNKEYSALQSEITADRQACSKLEDEILEVMLAVEQRVARIPELERGVREAREELAQFEASFQERRAVLSRQLEQAQHELKEVEGSLPEDMRPVYDRLIAAMGEDAMALVANRTCTTCYTEITAQNYNELRQERFVTCKNCGRILYLSE